MAFVLVITARPVLIMTLVVLGDPDRDSKLTHLLFADFLRCFSLATNPLAKVVLFRQQKKIDLLKIVFNCFCLNVIHI